MVCRTEGEPAADVLELGTDSLGQTGQLTILGWVNQPGLHLSVDPLYPRPVIMTHEFRKTHAFVLTRGAGWDDSNGGQDNWRSQQREWFEP
jgi:hypothetical protein